MLKKHISLALCGIGAVAMLSGCYTGGPVPVKNSTPTAAEGDIKTGLAVVTDLSGSAAPSDGKDGAGKTVFTAAAVLVDSEGTILSCDLDTLEASVNFSAEGKITSDLTLPFQTKGEKGDNYNMKGTSPIQKEWYEQAEAFCNYVVGKTADEVLGIAVDEATKPVEADLAAGVTISIGGYQQAIAEAVKRAKPLGAQAGEELRLVSTAAMSAADAPEGAAGSVQTDVTIAAVTMSGDTITSCVIDALQAKGSYDAQGQLVGDTGAAVRSKNDLGTDYGMGKISSIGKEWNEQAAAFSAYVAGKTLDEVAGIAVDESTKPAEADLAASVTISIGGFQALLEKLR